MQALQQNESFRYSHLRRGRREAQTRGKNKCIFTHHRECQRSLAKDGVLALHRTIGGASRTHGTDNHSQATSRHGGQDQPCESIFLDDDCDDGRDASVRFAAVLTSIFEERDPLQLQRSTSHTIVLSIPSAAVEDPVVDVEEKSTVLEITYLVRDGQNFYTQRNRSPLVLFNVVVVSRGKK